MQKGFRLLPGKVVRFPGESERRYLIKFRIWAGISLEWVNGSHSYRRLQEDYVYFVHSYYVKTDDP